MYFIFLSIALLSAVQAFPNNRIVNGTDAEPGEFPFIVSVRYYDDHYCGGSIINEYWVLTAGHCVDESRPFRFSVQYGVTHVSADGFNTVPVEKIIVHEKFAPSLAYRYDAALLKLAEPLQFSELVQPIALPPAFNDTPGGSDAVLAGWGSTSYGGDTVEDLQRVDLRVFTDEECETLHASTGPTDSRYNVCAGVYGGGKGQCNGDSGGPLVVNGTQVGVVSWSVKPCTIAPFPGVFSKVSSYVDWIYEKIAEDKSI